MKPSIVILDDWEHGLARLVDWSDIQNRSQLAIHHDRLRDEQLLAAVAQAQCIVLMRDRTPFPKSLIAQLPNLKRIIFTGTRNNTLDQQAAEAVGIKVTATEFGPSKASTCELAWSLIMASAKKLPDLLVSPQQPLWRTPAICQHLPEVLEGKRLGLIGLGHIGQRMAAVGRAFGMQVQAWSPHMTPERAREADASSVSLETLLSTSDVVSLHIVVSDATRKLLNSDTLALMQPGSLLVNTSRSSLIDTPALVKALQQGRPGFAALDVFDDEPGINPALLALPNLLLTPHMGFVSEQVYQKFSINVQHQLIQWLDENE
ncbi:lactate dehydrogenase-like 2-hydroxyacid dehydrogenase [Advenella incenata]|jgi:phosphoglycerate dehydrogenase-like enzyme|uniref:Lactate dehydrogenase-like 2-hydroxyacid dehydrogenase n=1 Tax=Advenella incenata TaxID=267800 RepID=A0A4V2FS42_9BURK|nr:D-2-hydroxyacid dehydrogenase family protein [Advenella incenata]RZT92819.1 lactate dehydrogenase-like 2-hydroxyacid dehydrogenase [Advenella incenata]